MPSFLIALILMLPLPDFSNAGCRPDLASSIPESQVNILKFGALPNDGLDDSVAIQKAIDSLAKSGGTVLFPAGTFVVEQRINVHANAIHLLGDNTTLYCPKPLADVYGESKNWSWSSGFLRMSAQGDVEELGVASGNALDGATSIKMNWKSDPPEVGQWVQLWWFNDTGHDTLFKWLYGDAVSPNKYGKELQKSTKRRVVSWFKVISIDGTTLTFDPPLPMPIKEQWNVQVMQVPYVEQCIVENLDFVFVQSEYPGHLKERGHNAIAGSALVDCLFKNITTQNADSGIILGGCGFTTVDGFKTFGRTMHHPICLSSCSHCLVENFELNAPHRHGTTISWCSHFNVFTNGTGNELAMDSHRACSFRNLHQNIKIHHGENPKQPLRSGGAYDRGLHAARENVYWNIEHVFPTNGEPFNISYLNEWPLGVFVGWHGNREIIIKQALDGQVIEHLNAPIDAVLY